MTNEEIKRKNDSQEELPPQKRNKSIDDNASLNLSCGLEMNIVSDINLCDSSGINQCSRNSDEMMTAVNNTISETDLKHRSDINDSPGLNQCSRKRGEMLTAINNTIIETDLKHRSDIDGSSGINQCSRKGEEMLTVVDNTTIETNLEHLTEIDDISGINQCGRMGDEMLIVINNTILEVDLNHHSDIDDESGINQCNGKGDEMLIAINNTIIETDLEHRSDTDDSSGTNECSRKGDEMLTEINYTIIETDLKHRSDIDDSSGINQCSSKGDEMLTAINNTIIETDLKHRSDIDDSSGINQCCSKGDEMLTAINNTIIETDLIHRSDIDDSSRINQCSRKGDEMLTAINNTIIETDLEHRSDINDSSGINQCSRKGDEMLTAINNTIIETDLKHRSNIGVQSHDDILLVDTHEPCFYVEDIECLGVAENVVIETESTEIIDDSTHIPANDEIDTKEVYNPEDGSCKLDGLEILSIAANMRIDTDSNRCTSANDPFLSGLATTSDVDESSTLERIDDIERITLAKNVIVEMFPNNCSGGISCASAVIDNNETPYTSETEEMCDSEGVKKVTFSTKVTSKPVFIAKKARALVSEKKIVKKVVKQKTKQLNLSALFEKTNQIASKKTSIFFSKKKINKEGTKTKNMKAKMNNKTRKSSTSVLARKRGDIGPKKKKPSVIETTLNRNLNILEGIATSEQNHLPSTSKKHRRDPYTDYSNPFEIVVPLIGKPRFSDAIVRMPENFSDKPAPLTPLGEMMRQKKLSMSTEERNRINKKRRDSDYRMAIEITKLTLLILKEMRNTDVDETRLMYYFVKFLRLPVSPLSLVYVPHFVHTMMYVRGSDIFSDRLRFVVNECFDKVHVLFPIPEGYNFETVYSSEVQKHLPEGLDDLEHMVLDYGDYERPESVVDSDESGLGDELADD